MTLRILRYNTNINNPALHLMLVHLPLILSDASRVKFKGQIEPQTREENTITIIVVRLKYCLQPVKKGLNLYQCSHVRNS